MENETKDQRAKRLRREAQARWRKANLEIARERTAKYQATTEGKERRRKWFKDRRASDVYFKLTQSVRNRVHIAIKTYTGKARKCKSSIDLLGCDLETYKLYLEALFEPGMSWANYGQWHIDHIRPLASFDLSEPSQQLEAFNFKNTQPLWALDNFVKSSIWAT